MANTDVYLDQNNNFISPKEYLMYETDDERVFNPWLNLDKDAFSQIAVSPRHVYHIYPIDKFHRFPSGTTALQPNTRYINLFLDSWIKKKSKTVGAKVFFTEEYSFNTDKIRPGYKEIFSSSNIGEKRTHVQLVHGYNNEYDIVSVKSDSDNLHIYKNTEGDIVVTTIGPVTATIDLAYRYDNAFVIHTIYVEPENSGSTENHVNSL